MNEQQRNQSGEPRARERTRAREPKPRSGSEPGLARLYALLAGALLALLGVLGFFYDAEFGTGSSYANDDLAGILIVNGWSNVLWLLSGVIALALAARHARAVAAGLGALYLVVAIWGFAVTERGIGSILDALPLNNNDNILHLVIGVVGLAAAIVDGPLPALPKPGLKALPRPRLRSRTKAKPKPGRAASAAAGAEEPGPRGAGGSRRRQTS